MGEPTVRLVFAAPFGPLELLAAPPCPHEGCGWFMPALSCPAHGNYGMTFLFARRGAVTWVKAVLDIPREPISDDEVRSAMAEYDWRMSLAAGGEQR